MLTVSPTCSERIVASSMGVVIFTRAIRRCYRFWNAVRMTRHAGGLSGIGRTDRCRDAGSREEARICGGSRNNNWSGRRWRRGCDHRHELGPRWLRMQHANGIALFRWFEIIGAIAVRNTNRERHENEHERDPPLHALIDAQ